MSNEIEQLSSEQAADLAEINAMAADVPQSPEAVAQQQGEAERRAQGVAGAQKIVSLVRTGCEVLKPEYFAGCPASAWDEIAVPLADTIEHYGWDVGDAFSHPVARLGLALLPVGGFVMLNVQKQKAEQEAKPQAIVSPGASAGAGVIAAPDLASGQAVKMGNVIAFPENHENK